MTTFEYKYVIVDSDTKEVYRWETLPKNGNRMITVTQKGILSAVKNEGSLQTKINKIKLTKSVFSIFKNRLSLYRGKDKPKKMK